MRNTVQVQGSRDSTKFGNLDYGQMFKTCAPMNEENVYMKTDHQKCVLLTTGCMYGFAYDREVVPLKSGTVIKITSGE